MCDQLELPRKWEWGEVGSPMVMLPGRQVPTDNGVWVEEAVVGGR